MSYEIILFAVCVVLFIILIVNHTNNGESYSTLNELGSMKSGGEALPDFIAISPVAYQKVNNNKYGDDTDYEKIHQRRAIGQLHPEQN